MKTTRLLFSLFLLAGLASASAQTVGSFTPNITTSTQLQNLSPITVTRPVNVETTLTGLPVSTVSSMRQGVPTPRRQSATFVGAVTGTKARIAILSDGVTASAFVTDGAASTSLTAWLEGTAVNGRLDLDGAPCLPRPASAPRLTGTITAATASGSIRIAGKNRLFTAVKTTTPAAGLYHRVENQVLVGMIVDDKGTTVSVARRLQGRQLAKVKTVIAPDAKGRAVVSVPRSGTMPAASVTVNLQLAPLPGLRWLWNNRPASATKAAVLTELGNFNHLGQPIKPFDIQVVPNQEQVAVFMFTDQMNHSVMLNHPLLNPVTDGTLMEQAHFRDQPIQVFDLALENGIAAIGTQHFGQRNNGFVRTDCRVQLAELRPNGQLNGLNSFTFGAAAGANPGLSGFSSHLPLVWFDAGTRVTRAPGGFIMTSPGAGQVFRLARGAQAATLLVNSFTPSPWNSHGEQAVAIRDNGQTRVLVGGILQRSRDDGGVLHSVSNGVIAPGFEPATLRLDFLHQTNQVVRVADVTNFGSGLLVAVHGRGLPAGRRFAGFIDPRSSEFKDFWALLEVRADGTQQVLAHKIDSTPNAKDSLDAAITGIDILEGPEGRHVMIADNGVRTPGTDPLVDFTQVAVSPNVPGPLPPPNDQHHSPGRILRLSPSQQAAEALELRTARARQAANNP